MQDLITSITTGIALGLSAGFAPGPLTTLLLAETLRHGRTAGMRIACVPLFSDLPVVLLSVGLLVRVAHLDTVLGGISLAGAAFVAYLAVDNLRAAPPTPSTHRTPPSSLVRGVLTNWANPHPYLFWVAVGAPLIIRPGSRLAAALFILCFYACLVGAKLCMALTVGHFRQRLLGGWYVLLNRLLGSALLLLALMLLRDAWAFLTR